MTKHRTKISLSQDTSKQEARKVVPISTISALLRMKMCKELQFYLFLRQISHDKAGIFHKTDLPKACNYFNLSPDTIGRRLKNCIKIGMIRKFDNYYQIVGLRKIALNLPNDKAHRTRTNAAAELTIPINSPKLVFKAWCLEAYKAKNIIYRNKYGRFLTTEFSWKDKCKVQRSSFCGNNPITKYRRKDELQSNQGCFSHSLVQSNLEIAPSTASKLKQVAIQHDFARYESQFAEGYENVAADASKIDFFIKCHELETGRNIRPFLIQHEDGHWGVRSCDLITSYIPIIRYRIRYS